MKILLVRLRLIGDVVFTTPVIRAVRRRWPTAHLTYLVEQSAAPVVLHNPYLDDVLVVPHSRGWTRLADDWRIARRLRAARYDLAIDLHGGPRSAWLTWASRAPARVGYDVAGRAWMYTRVVHRPRVLRPRHSVENQWDLLAGVDAAFTHGPSPETDPVEMPVEDAARTAVDQWLAEAAVPVPARLIVLHVSAGNPFRRWPEAAFAEVAARLAGTAPNRWVAVTAGPSDRAAAGRVLAAARGAVGAGAARILDAEGFSLQQLRALVGRAALFIGGDSGPLHIAATSDVAVVGLYGPTLAERSAPWRPRDRPTVSLDAGSLPCRPCDQRVCAPGDFRCLTRISAPQVIEAAERLLGATE